LKRRTSARSPLLTTLRLEIHERGFVLASIDEMAALVNMVG
jgi:hypothetical protein